MTKAERQKQEAEIMVQLEADRKAFARVSEIDEAMNEVKRCSRLCGKTKDGLGYQWYGNIISAMRKALELYDNKSDTPQEGTATANHFYGREGESK